ncbi:MAG TPA: murein biosynthesis integral membrane protein MurJ [Acidimicrobiales bacterium]|nr:murein biosynthesis integral membrane protein MurJ [Acidimicrobiales bacterium]
MRNRFARDSAVMAVGTALSRVTGVLRLLALIYAVHFRALADAYNLANTMPNVVHDVVLGGIVSATFVPVFVSRLSARSESEAWDAISAVASVTVLVMGAASILFLVASPFIVDAMTALNHASQAGVERTVATELLVLFVPQLACYGCISLATALLNARREFAAPMFAPIANNVVTALALVAFGLVVRDPTLGGVYAHRGQLLLLGLGTTVGVVAQAVAMVPALRKADLHLRWRPRFGHEAVRTIMRLSGWTVGLVVGNQLALVVVLAMSVRVGQGAVTAYTYAWTFFQLPYGVVAVSIMSAVAPELAARWTRGELPAFRRRMDGGMRSMLAIILPAAAAMVIMAKPLLALLGHLIGHSGSTDTTAVALAMLSLGLPGFCVFLYVIRVLQSMQDVRTAFWLYGLENAVNVVGAVALAGPLGVRGIALSIAIAYTVGAVAGLWHVRTKVGGLTGDHLWRPVGRSALATVALVVGTVLGTSISASESLPALFARLLLGGLAGVAFYVTGAGVLAHFHHERRPAGRRQVLASTATSHPGEAIDSDPGAGPGLSALEDLGGDDRGAFGSAAPAPSRDEEETDAVDSGSPGLVPGARRGRLLSSPTTSGERIRRARRRGGAPPPPERLPPAGRPPLRPDRLGPTVRRRDGDDEGRGRLGP